MTDKEFHYAYAKLFLSLRDFHTNYNMPSPHRCYTAVTAVLFQLADSADIENDPAVVVSAYSSFKKVLSMSPEYNKTSLGDQLLKIDGLTFREYHLKTAFQTGGANLYGGYRSALSSISYIGGMMYPMPENNTLTLEMRSAKTQENYTVKLPWIASSKDACMKEYNDFLVAPKKNAFTTTPLKLKRKKELPSTNPLFKELKESFAIKQLSIKMQATSDPIITYAIFNPNAENLGIIAMDSFLPLGSDIDKLVLLIRSLLVGELANTKSLVFDIRDNGGGAVSMADLIPQLFGRNPYIAKFRALVSPLNQKLFSAGYEGTDWARNYNASKPGDLFTPAIAFDSDKRANRYGQAYFKPVGVLNNGNW